VTPPSTDPALGHHGLGRIGPERVTCELGMAFLYEHAPGVDIRTEHDVSPLHSVGPRRATAVAVQDERGGDEGQRREARAGDD
jgi:hypothetical protein